MRRFYAILIGGAVGAGVAGVLAWKTKKDLTTAGAALQDGLARVGAMDQRTLQAHANQWAAEIRDQAQAKIRALAMSNALDVVQNTYGITPSFVAQTQAISRRIAAGEATVITMLGRH
jgi:hypothetical protein